MKLDMRKLIQWPSKTVYLVTLWLVFSFGCLAAIVLSPIAPLFWRKAYFRNFIKASDRMCAALLGYSGRNMLSTELAHSPDYKWMKRALEGIEADHCWKSMVDEHAYCSLRDHQIRTKG